MERASTRRRQTCVPPSIHATVQGSTSRCSGTSAASTGTSGSAASQVERCTPRSGRRRGGASPRPSVAGGAAGVAHGDGVPLVGGPSRRGQRACAASSASYSSCRTEALAGAGVFAVATSITTGALRPCSAQQDARAPRPSPRRELAVGDHHRGFAVVHLPGEQRGGVEPRVHLRFSVLIAPRRAPAPRSAPRPSPGVLGSSRTIAQRAPIVAPRAVDHHRQVAEHLGAAFDEAHRAQGDEVGGVLQASCWS